MMQQKQILNLYDRLRDILSFYGKNENVNIITVVYANANIFSFVNIEIMKNKQLIYKPIKNINT